jgi:hypothetical protein
MALACSVPYTLLGNAGRLDSIMLAGLIQEIHLVRAFDRKKNRVCLKSLFCEGYFRRHGAGNVGVGDCKRKTCQPVIKSTYHGSEQQMY